MKVAEMIRRELEQQGFQNMKDAAKFLDISLELLRITVNQGHIPKDAILVKIASRLDLDRVALLLAAHQERVPIEAQGYFLSPVKRQSWTKKRVWPLSWEQCEYLGKVMDDMEIQIIRKLRQVPDEEKRQIVGYVDYTWLSKRVINERDEEEKK
jgi:hypothetical protein